MEYLSDPLTEPLKDGTCEDLVYLENLGRLLYSVIKELNFEGLCFDIFTYSL
jgi:hypothetical protein